MKAAMLLLASVVAVSLAVIAWVLAAEEFAQPTMGDADLVWCDANRALVGLAAESLGLMAEDLADTAVNLVGDDPADHLADLEGLSALEALRYFRQVAQNVPPEYFADLGYPTEDAFEEFSVLAPRSLRGSITVATTWLLGLDGEWDHPDASRACVAAVSAFR